MLAKLLLRALRADRADGGRAPVAEFRVAGAAAGLRVGGPSRRASPGRRLWRRLPSPSRRLGDAVPSLPRRDHRRATASSARAGSGRRGLTQAAASVAPPAGPSRFFAAPAALVTRGAEDLQRTHGGVAERRATFLSHPPCTLESWSCSSSPSPSSASSPSRRSWRQWSRLNCGVLSRSQAGRRPSARPAPPGPAARARPGDRAGGRSAGAAGRPHGEMSARLDGCGARCTGELAETARHLREALASPKARGQWGERMADDVLRLAGLVEGVNYRRQTASPAAAIPDVTFLLPGRLVLHMDVKFPIDNYLRASRGAERRRASTRRKPRSCATCVSAIKEITGRGYIDPGRTVDHVLLFIPNESVYSFVHEHDSDAGRRRAARRRWCCVRRSRCSPCWPSSARRSTRSSSSGHRTRCCAASGASASSGTSSPRQLDSVGRRLDTAQRGFEELAGPRRRQLERQLDRLDELRNQRRARRSRAADEHDDGRAAGERPQRAGRSEPQAPPGTDQRLMPGSRGSWQRSLG